MHEPNPYQTPAAAPGIAPGSQPALGELVKSWEKQRLAYNAILLLPGILSMASWVWRAELAAGAAILISLVCGLAANLAFFAGPLAELYLRAIFFGGRPIPVLRRGLFGGGLVISLGVIAVYGLIGWLAFTPRPAAPLF